MASPMRETLISPAQLIGILPETGLPGVVVGSSDTSMRIRLLLGDTRIDEALIFDAEPDPSITDGDHVSFTRRTTRERYATASDIPPIRGSWAHDVKRISEEQAGDLAALVRSVYDIGYYGFLMDWHEELTNIAARLLDIEACQRETEANLTRRKQRITASERGIDARKQELDERSTDIEKKERDLEDRAIELSAKESTLKSQEDALKELEREIAPYRRFLPLGTGVTEKAPMDVASLPRRLGQTWPSLLAKRGAALPSDVANAYLLALMTSVVTGRLVLLDGPVGSGKTSIVSASAEILDAYHEVIPVRPGWLDSTDLLGYFDPISRVYRPTSLVEHVVEANDDDSRLSLLCLDELNLARIENYAADLLSVLEYRSEEPSGNKKATARGLELYPRFTFQSLFAELDELERRGGEAIGEVAERTEVLRSMLSRYPDHIAIPRNLVLLGTLNSDQTTYELSPKVIDRSFVVPFPSAFENTSNSPAMDHRLDARISTAAVNSVAQRAQEYAVDWPSVEMLDEYVRQVGIPLSHRVKRDYGVFRALATAIGIPEPDSNALFILTRVIPRIGFVKRRSLGGAGSGTDKRVQVCGDLLDHLSRNEGSNALRGLIEQLRWQLQDSHSFDVGMWRGLR